MLKLVNVNSAAKGSLSVDEYIPLSFRAQPADRPSPIYWRTGDLSRQMFTLKIDSFSGEVYGATLEFTDQEIIFDEMTKSFDIQTDSGLPIVETSSFLMTVNDYPAPFKLIRSKQNFIIMFDDHSNPTNCLTVDRACFILNGSILMGISFGPLTEQELKTFAIWEKYR